MTKRRKVAVSKKEGKMSADELSEKIDVLVCREIKKGREMKK